MYENKRCEFIKSERPPLPWVLLNFEHHNRFKFFESAASLNLHPLACVSQYNRLDYLHCLRRSIGDLSLSFLLKWRAVPAYATQRPFS